MSGQKKEFKLQSIPPTFRREEVRFKTWCSAGFIIFLLNMAFDLFNVFNLPQSKHPQIEDLEFWDLTEYLDVEQMRN